jgi:DNA-binding transcriptional MerR regulator
MKTSQPGSWGVGETAHLVGVERRTLALWLQRGIVKASVAPPRGRREEIRLSLDDVLEISLVAFLRQERVSMQQVRGIVERLRAEGQRLSDFELLVVTGEGEVIGFRGRLSAMTLAKHPGQALLLPVAHWRQQAERVQERAGRAHALSR